MSNDDFRRELGQVFDDMTGSHSAALPDRVRSSLAHAPESKGPYWIAGIAAAVIAAVVIGVMFVGNPLNRPANTIGPAVGPSPTPGGSPSAAPDSNLQPFTCAESSMIIYYASPPPMAVIDALRTGTHPGYDRLTIELKSGGLTDIEVRTQTGTTFTRSPRGDQVTLAGENGILVVIHGADLHTGYSGPADIKTGYSALIEVQQIEDFEGTVQLALGVSGAACHRAFLLTNPDRLVIDVQAA